MLRKISVSANATSGNSQSVDGLKAMKYQACATTRTSWDLWLPPSPEDAADLAVSFMSDKCEQHLTNLAAGMEAQVFKHNER